MKLVHLSFAAAILLMVAPGPHASAFSGAPLSGSGRLLLVMLVSAWSIASILKPAVGRAVPALLLALVVTKVLLGPGSVPTGWRAEYESTGSPGLSGEFFWRFASHDYRLDPRIDFDDETFNLHFLNDVTIFGFHSTTTRRDIALPLQARWTGYVRLDVPQRLVVAGSARGTLVLDIDQAHVARTTVPDAGFALTTEVLAPGWHRLAVVYDKPTDVIPKVRFSVAPEAGANDVVVRPSPAGPPVHWLATAAAPLGTLAVAAGLAVLVVGLASGWRADAPPWPGLAAGAAVACTCWLAFAAVPDWMALLGRTIHLWSGDDMLMYATKGHDVLHHGLHMPLGQIPGRGAAFYFYPLYGYAIAVAYALIGEDQAAIVLFNGLTVIVLPALFWRLGWSRLPALAAAVAYGVLAMFSAYHLQPYTGNAMSDSLFVAVLFVFLVIGSRALASHRPADMFKAGAALALAAATRPSAMTMLGILPLLALVTSWRHGAVDGWRRAGAGIAGFVAGVLPFTIRNLVMSGTFVLLVSSWVQIPFFLVPPEAPVPSFGRPTLSQSVVIAAGLLRADPLGVIWLELRKLLFTVGFTQLGPAPAIARPELVLLALLFVAVLALRRMPSHLSLLLAGLAVSHTLAMIIAAPWTYGYKSILPLHAVFLFGAAFLLAPRPKVLAPTAGAKVDY